MKKKQVIDKYIEPIFSSGTIYIIKNMDVDYLAKRFNYKCATNDDFKQDLIESRDSSEGTTCYYVVENSTGLYVILILLNPKFLYKKPEIINLMAHESLHAAFRMLDLNSISLDSSTNELFANLVGWLTECCYKTYYKK